MINAKLLDDLSSKLSQLAASGPLADVEKNTKALLAGMFSRLDLVSREEFEVQKLLLQQAQARLASLEAKLAELEKRPGA